MPIGLGESCRRDGRNDPPFFTYGAMDGLDDGLLARPYIHCPTYGAKQALDTHICWHCGPNMQWNLDLVTHMRPWKYVVSTQSKGREDPKK
jgi:hypothetical protein